MANKPDSWMPLHIEPWTKKTARLPAAARGAYLDLLLAYWSGEELPANDDDTLMRLARCTEKEWKAVSAKVLAYFYVEGDLLRNKRADEEKAEAAARYERKSRSGKAGGEASGKQRRSKNEAEAEQTAKHQPTQSTLVQSPNGDGDAIASPPKPPRSTKRTRLENDWQPSADDLAAAAGEGLTPDEIAADLAEWREYWTGPEPRDPLKVSWSITYRKHVKQFAPGIIARRARAGRPKDHRQGPGSVFAALSQNLCERDLGGQGDGGDGLGWGTSEDRTDEPGRSGGLIEGHTGCEIDAEADAECGDSEGLSALAASHKG